MMDINLALENTLLNTRMRTSELLSNIDGVLFLMKQCKFSPDLDIPRLTPLIEELYSDYFFSNLSYAKDEESFFNKYNYIKKEYQDFFERKIEEQPFYNACISNLCSRVTVMDKTYLQKFMSENVNFNNIEDITKHHIAVGLLKGKAHSALDILLKNKIIDTDFINKDYDGNQNLIQQNIRNSFYPYMVDSEILKVFIKNGLDLNSKKRLCYIIGINMHRDPSIKNILKNHLTTENNNALNEQVYNYQNGKFIEDFRKFVATRSEPNPSNAEFQAKTGFRDFWTLKYNNENIFYNLIRKSESDDLNKDTASRIIDRIIADKDNLKKYQRMYEEKNKDGLNILEFLIKQYHAKNGGKCSINEEWLYSLLKICKIDPINDISSALRNSNLDAVFQEHILNSIKENNDKETICKIFIGEDSLLFENEIKSIISSMLSGNSRKYNDKKLLMQMEFLDIIDSELYKDKYISGSLYLYISCLKEMGFDISKNEEDFYEELKNKNPLLHNYEHKHESLKIYISELEKNHLLNAATQSTDVPVKSIRRL